MLIGKLQHKRRKHTIWFLGQNTVLKKAWHKLCDYYSAIWADIFVKLKEYIDIVVLHHILTFQISMYKIGDVANARDTLSSDARDTVKCLWNISELFLSNSKPYYLYNPNIATWYLYEHLKYSCAKSAWRMSRFSDQYHVLTLLEPPLL